MKETNFIKQNKEKWLEFEKILNQKNKNPDRLSSLFVQVTDDLSYSRTFYPNRSVKIYLNNIAQQVFVNIYKNRKARFRRIVNFWKEELPQLVFEARSELLVSFLIFVLSFVIGWVSSANDSSFARFILGDGYVQMTIENIKSGDPMAVYKHGHQADMFFAITWNNIQVAFFCFILGITFGTFTVIMLVYNGIMLGTFQHFFYQYGLLKTCSMTIWLHGTLEISSIIIAGGAGLTMARGLVFPGTFTRLQAFQLSAKRGLKVMAGTVPLFIIAGFIESFVTRYYQYSQVLNGILIAVSLFFILGYFVFYPRWKAKRGFVMPLTESKLPAPLPHVIDYGAIRTNGEIFRDIFWLYRKYFWKLFKVFLVTTILYSVYMGWSLLRDFDPEYFQSYNPLSQIFRLAFFFFRFFTYGRHPEFAIANVIFMAVNFYAVCYFLHKESDQERFRYGPWKYFVKNFYKPLAAAVLLNVLLLVPEGWGVFLMLTGMPFVLLWLFIQHKEQRVLGGLGKMFSLSGEAFGRFFGSYLMVLFVSFIYFFLIGSPFLLLFLEAYQVNVSTDYQTIEKVFAGFLVVTSALGLALALPLVTFGIGMVYFSLNEIREAISIKARIAIIGKRKQGNGNA